MGNAAERLRKDQEGTRSNGRPGGCHTIVPAGAPLRVLAPSSGSFLHHLS